MAEKKITPKRPEAEKGSKEPALDARKISLIKRIKRSGDDGRIAVNHAESWL